MNAENKMTIKSVNLNDTKLHSVIYGAIGNASKNKILEVIKSYGNPDNEIIGVFIDCFLILQECKNTFLVLDGTPTSLKDDPIFANLIPGFDKNGDQIQKITHKPDFSKLFTAGDIISTSIDLVKGQYGLISGAYPSPKIA